MSIESFINEKGQIKTWPSKFAKKREIVEYLADKFAFDIIYTEKELNAVIEKWHTFNDPILLRRSLIDYGFFDREKDGSKYWRIPQEEVQL